VSHDPILTPLPRRRAGSPARAFAFALALAATLALPPAAGRAQAEPGAGAAAAGAATDAGFAWSGTEDAARFAARCAGTLALADSALRELLVPQGARTVENTLVPYNRAVLLADNAAQDAQLFEAVHPDSAFRAAAEAVKRDASRFLTELSLNRGAFDALKAVRLDGADPATRVFVQKTLRSFRLSGVDRDEATRKQVAALNDSLVAIAQEFERNIREDSRTIQVAPEELAGLPDDYIRAHPAGPDGKVSISIEFPDYFPVMNYCRSEAVRHRLFVGAQNRAYPANAPVLQRLLARRHELARLLGFKTWADCATADKMTGSGAKAESFLSRLNGLTMGPARTEYAAYLKRKQEDDPTAKAVQIWERRYYGEQIRARDYGFNAQDARPYFAFARVKQGVLDITSRLFGLSYRRVENAPAWHPGVEAYEVIEGERLIGRFYLDLHPRDGKFNGAANFPIRTGSAGIQLPQCALVANFAGGNPDDPGLMEHEDVVVFFHEFGHLLHGILGGHQRWEPISGFATEWDFVEAPSQLLEEWAWNAGSLRTFAKHHETGESIPEEMVARMRHANTFGRAVSNAFQVEYSALSLHLHDRDPAKVDPDAVFRDAEERYQPFPPVPEIHMATSFGHLAGYSAIYYTYMWSLVIAKDLYSRFDPARPLDPEVPRLYRDRILAPGGSKPAAELVRSFLGRDFRYDAYEKWLSEKN
jgi:thimet oligopeptidase